MVTLEMTQTLEQQPYKINRKISHFSILGMKLIISVTRQEGKHIQL